MEKTLPEFKGKALIDPSVALPHIGFLEGDFGEAFLEEYKGRSNSDYKGARQLDVLRYNGQTVTGSNPFTVVLANQILSQEGLRTASQADLETAMRVGAMDLRGTYEDTALVLRSDEDRDWSANTAIARDLGKQLKARGIKYSAKSPAVIPLTSLELNTADNNYRLSFRLTEDGKVYEAQILSGDGDFDSEDLDRKTGLPRKLMGGKRHLYTRGNGLSGLYLDDDLNVISDGRGLDNSDDDGRVVVVSAEGTSPDLDKYLERLKESKDAEVAKIEARYQKAEAILRGK